MKLSFRIEYFTEFGERVVLSIGRKVYDMEYEGPGIWAVSNVKTSSSDQTYTFEIRKGQQVLRKEARVHQLPQEGLAKEGVVLCQWNDFSAQQPFYSSLFTQSLFRRKPGQVQQRKGNLLMQVSDPVIRPDYHLALATDVLGWEKFLLLDDRQFPFWSIQLDIRRPFEYKYVLIEKENGRAVWENGKNRYFSPVQGAGDEILIVEDNVPEFDIEPWRGMGTAIPVFSLKSEDSFGVGEFLDLKKMVDWAVLTGQKIIQVLPINDTTMTRTWQDSYPYNANSSFALHPQFVNLPAAGQRKTKAYLALQQELNALAQIDYERVNNEKDALLRKLYGKAEKVLQSEEYKEFVRDSYEWLMPYAVFSCLRDETGTPDFAQWGKMARFSKKKAENYRKAHAQEVEYYFYVQYLLDKQLKEAVAYAHSKGVALKGDLPIGISRTSADAWQNPELYNMDSQAGAPPDAFSEDGQNWGFPTYNWEKMAEDGYAWWKSRLNKMGQYFDAFRIDHILGFFRIWEIPTAYKSGLMGHFNPAMPYHRNELEGKGFYLKPCTDTNVLFVEDPHYEGYYHPRIAAQNTEEYARLDQWHKDEFNRLYDDFFYHRHNAFWKACALKKLPALLSSTRMLACGEDLGMIPSCVPEVMDEMKILSLEIERMPKDPQHEFADTRSYPYLCVCATGTHDTATLRAWWEENPESTSRYYRQVLGHTGEAPEHLTPELAEEILVNHLQSNAMFTILPFQDWMALDGDLRFQGAPEAERINIPANPRHYWRYRMHMSLEELIRSDSFNGKMLRLSELR